MHTLLVLLPWSLTGPSPPAHSPRLPNLPFTGLPLLWLCFLWGLHKYDHTCLLCTVTPQLTHPSSAGAGRSAYLRVDTQPHFSWANTKEWDGWGTWQVPVRKGQTVFKAPIWIVLPTTMSEMWHRQDPPSCPSLWPVTVSLRLELALPGCRALRVLAERPGGILWLRPPVTAGCAFSSSCSSHTLCAGPWRGIYPADSSSLSLSLACFSFSLLRVVKNFSFSPNTNFHVFYFCVWMSNYYKTILRYSVTMGHLTKTRACSTRLHRPICGLHSAPLPCIGTRLSLEIRQQETLQFSSSF